MMITYTNLFKQRFINDNFDVGKWLPILLCVFSKIIINLLINLRPRTQHYRNTAG